MGEREKREIAMMPQVSLRHCAHQIPGRDARVDDSLARFCRRYLVRRFPFLLGSQAVMVDARMAKV